MSNVIAIATLISVLAAVLQLGGLRKQRRRAFEDFYVQRYWKIMDDLSLSAIMSTKPDDGTVEPEDEKAVIAFLRLSEDELDLRGKGWISDDTWDLWWDGMVTQLHRWPFDEVWAKVCRIEDDAGDQGQFQQLRGLRDEITDKAPPKPGLPLWRRFGQGP